MKAFKKAVASVLCLLMLCAPLTMVQATQPQERESATMDEQGKVNVGDCEIEYSIYGAQNSQALVLLPGNGSDMHAFDGSILPEMSKHYKVICFSPRGNGGSGRGEGKLTFEVMADDLAKVLDYLEIKKTYVFGFSDGGNLALVFTLRHPDYVTKLVPMSANINMWGTKISSEIGIVFKYLVLCIEAAITKDPAIALKRDIEGMMVGQPTLKFSDLENIKCPTLNIFGEHDMMFRSHSKRITKSIPGCKELMVIGGAHGSCFDYTDTVINPALIEFFG